MLHLISILRLAFISKKGQEKYEKLFKTELNYLTGINFTQKVLILLVLVAKLIFLSVKSLKIALKVKFVIFVTRIFMKNCIWATFLCIGQLFGHLGN